MSIFNKIRSASPETTSRSAAAGAIHAATSTAVMNARNSGAATGGASHGGRLSNGLKEFLWQLDGIGHGRLLDLGQARQTTLNFFIERGFKVYTDDFLTTWKKFLDAEDQKKSAVGLDVERLAEHTPSARAQRFLDSMLQYPEETFDAVLMWDVLDYVDTELMAKLAMKVTSLLRDGGVVFAIFHARKPETFHRYRVVDAQNLELIPASCPFAPQRVLQNREISNLFSRYRSSKTFVGRDQLREGMFVK